MAKTIHDTDETRTKIINGARKTYEAVAATYGPLSGNVAIQEGYGEPTITHDGVTVAKKVELEDPLENIGAQLIIQGSKKTNNVAGDGTSASVILAYNIIDKASRQIAAGVNPMLLRKGIDRASGILVDKIKELGIEATKEQLAQAAVISCGNEAEGALVADTVTTIGESGGITVQDFPGINLEQEIVEGFYFEQGYADIRQVTDIETLETNYSDCHVMVLEKRINSNGDLRPLFDGVLGEIAKSGNKRLLIVGNIGGEALNSLLANKLNGNLESVTVAPPVYGDQLPLFLEDVALLTGASFISTGADLTKITLEDIGKADRVVVKETSTTILGGSGDKEKIAERIEVLKKQLKVEPSAFRRERMELRLSKLSGKVGLIKVGGATEAEAKERRMRIDDAVCATRAARDSGIVAGGATTLLRLSVISEEVKPEEEAGFNVVLSALQEPFNKLMENSDLSVDHYRNLVLKNKDKECGFNVLKPTGEPINLIKEGVVDPVKVLQQVVENACSVASMIITTNKAITVIPESKES